MPNFSPKTVGVLAQYLDWGYSHGDLDNLFLRHSLKDAPKGSGNGPNKLKRATAALTDAFQRGDQDTIKSIIEEAIEGRPTDSENSIVEALQDALRADGWSLEAVEYERPNRSQWDTRTYTRFELSVLGAGALPLVDETTALQRVLGQLGLTTAAGHYKQAVEGNAAGKWASANGQLRATFESVLVAIGKKLNPNANAQNGGGAINAIDKASAFEKGERNYIDGLWTLAHSNGAHPGLSDEEESTNRLAAVTAAIAYLLRRFM